MMELDTGLTTDLIGLGIATAVGVLVGLEREWEDKPVGLRSFILIGMTGGLAALLNTVAGGWVIAAGLIGLAVLLSFVTTRREGVTGTTTLIAALVVFMLGAAAGSGYWVPAVVLGGLVTLLLHWKAPLHGWVSRIGRDDFEIIARFVLMAIVILPLLPDRTFGPYDVFNPFEAWLLVVLIVTINLVGYLALRFTASDAGAWMAGLLGGLISSTATTVSYAGISKRSPNVSTLCVLVILVASTVVYARMLIELMVVAPQLGGSMLAPAVVFSLLLLAMCLLVYFRMHRRKAVYTDMPESGNPARIRAALSFAGLYVLILLAVAFTRDRLGNEAFYFVAAVSGLTDVDALTISTGQLFARGRVDADTAWRAIFLASLSNLLFKGCAASFLGSRELRKAVVPPVLIALAAGGAIIWFWPS